ncbi:hypothetical protein SeLEV6574_g06642 [Synchytrium endobioticum]|uniref:RING-type domain-containing protein n=1 Tax=Synchytrium endobioticum TaxID=286115 RepID=A0A507CKX7_9FUNG|nr:hypothetical protein SeLEV6574_g06642 [Synchytrium endobioticum]
MEETVGMIDRCMDLAKFTAAIHGVLDPFMKTLHILPPRWRYKLKRELNKLVCELEGREPDIGPQLLKSDPEAVRKYSIVLERINRMFAQLDGAMPSMSSFDQFCANNDFRIMRRKWDADSDIIQCVESVWVELDRLLNFPRRHYFDDSTFDMLRATYRWLERNSVGENPWQDTAIRQESWENSAYQEPVECSICREYLEAVHQKTLYCGHQFHEHCIDQWEMYAESCPCCRSELQLAKPDCKSVLLMRKRAADMFRSVINAQSERRPLLSPTPLDNRNPSLASDFDIAAASRSNLLGSTATLSSARFVQTSWTREKIKNRLKYYVPFLSWMPRYNFKRDLVSDFTAGLTVAFLLIPGGLAYSSLVQVPPVHGLLTGFVPLIVYALLGTSRQLATGPEALVSTLVGAAISQLNTHHITPDVERVHDNSERLAENVATASLLALMVGLWTFLLGVFRLGFLDSVISRPLLRGFVTAIAVVVGIEMLAPLLGLPKVLSETGTPPSPIEKLWGVIEELPGAHLLTVIISVSSVAFLLGIRWIKLKFGEEKRWLQLLPEILVLVALSTTLSAVCRWDLAGVVVLKDVHGGFVSPKFPKISLSKIKLMLLSSILIAVIGFVESIVGAKTCAAKHHYSVSPNRELVALGMANLIGCSFGSWPCFGSLGRTMINDTAGARTQMAGLITGLFTFTTSLLLLPYFYFLPRAVCSSIIIVAVSRLVELNDVHFILKLRAWSDLGLLLLTFCTTVFISIEAGTLISVGVSLLLVVKESTKTRISILGMTYVVDTSTGLVKPKFRSIQEQHQAERIQGCLVIRIEEGLFFGNSGQLQQLVRRVEAHGELGVHPGEAPRKRVGKLNGVRATGVSPGADGSPVILSPDQDAEITSLVLDIENMTFIDASSTQVLLELVRDYQKRDITICFVKLRDSCKPNFIRSGIYDAVGPSRFFVKTRDALQYLSELHFIPSIPALSTYKPLPKAPPPADDSNSSAFYHATDADTNQTTIRYQQSIPQPPRFMFVDNERSRDRGLHGNKYTAATPALSSSAPNTMPHNTYLMPPRQSPSNPDNNAAQ